METRQYYLGIAGDQTGPFSNKEVLDKIKAGQVPSDSLIWYEGLPEWQAIATVEFFKGAFETPEQSSQMPPAPSPPVSAPANLRGHPASHAATASPAPAVSHSSGPTAIAATATPRRIHAEPTFAEDKFADEDQGMGKKTKALIAAGVVLAICVGIAGYFLSGGEQTSNEPVKVVKKDPAEQRDVQLRKIMSEMLLKPEVSVAALRKLIVEKSDDVVGKQALSEVLQYYKQTQRPSEAGHLLMELKQYAEASKLFLSDTTPSAKGDAEVALYKAYEQSTDPNQKRDALLENIKLLVGVLDNKDLANERIRLFAKDFPNVPHPYGYYLKSNDEKVIDLFNRISFYFVQGLMAYTYSEFPEMKFDSRPIVEIVKEKPDQFRIVGHYRGEVLLNRDRLRDIFFTFWMAAGQWTVVETNLTAERKSWAARNRERLVPKVMTSKELLAYTEGIFKSQFPEIGFHENVDPSKMVKPKKED